MLGGNEYFATELQAVQGKERYDIKISQNTSNVSPNEGQKTKTKTKTKLGLSFTSVKKMLKSNDLSLSIQ